MSSAVWTLLKLKLPSSSSPPYLPSTSSPLKDDHLQMLQGLV